VANVLGSPLPQELLGAQLRFGVGGEGRVECVEVVGEEGARVAEHVLGVEVEGVGHPVEDERITDHDWASKRSFA
jgi:hypothetical protein